MLANEDVTFAALTRPHFDLTRRQCSQQRHVLLLDDTTEVNFGHRAEIEGLGMLNHEQHQGFLLHSSLAVDAASGEVLGLAGQTIRHRQRVKREHANRRLQREDRESRLWGDVIDQVGPPPDGVRYTHVCDRGADNFEVLCHFVQQRCDFVVRAAQLTRTVEVAGANVSLQAALEAAPPLGTYQLDVPASPKQKARAALLEVRAVKVTLPRPRNTTAYVRQSGIRSITLDAVEAREVKPRSGWPAKQEPLHWVLLTSHQSTSVRLLQIKTLAKRDPEHPAESLVLKTWLTTLAHLRNKEITTIRQFLRELAGLGGFLGRKCDGEPGWITLWRGFDKLSLILHGLEIPRRRFG